MSEQSDNQNPNGQMDGQMDGQSDVEPDPQPGALPDRPADSQSDQASGHEPVLIQEVRGLLDPQPGLVMLACTVGRAAHATSVIPKLAPAGRFIGLDVDQTNIDFCRARLAGAPVTVDLVQANFAQARGVLDQLNIDHVDLLLADLGFASNQMADPARGFSF